MTTSQLQAWELFTQEYGFDWFYAPLITGQVGRWRVVDHLLRFIDNPQVSLQQKDRWAVSIAAEQQKIDPECMFELQCDEIIECLEKAHLPPVIVDWTQFSAGWGNKAKWGAPNG